METHKHTRKTIVRLLSSMGSAKEIQQYLKRFSELDAKRPGRSHPQAVDGVLLDAGGGQLLVQLRTGAMQHDRGQPHLLQEGQRRGQVGQLVAQHRAADLHHGETLGVDFGETLEVLLDFLRAAHAREQAHDGLSGVLMRFHCHVPLHSSVNAGVGNRPSWPDFSTRRWTVSAYSCNWSSATHSSALWAWAMSPGP